MRTNKTSILSFIFDSCREVWDLLRWYRSKVFFGLKGYCADENVWASQCRDFISKWEQRYDIDFFGLAWLRSGNNHFESFHRSRHPANLFQNSKAQNVFAHCCEMHPDLSCESDLSWYLVYRYKAGRKHFSVQQKIH